MEYEDEEQRGEKDIESPDVVDKYKAAAEIANSTVLVLFDGYYSIALRGDSLEPMTCRGSCENTFALLFPASCSFPGPSGLLNIIT